MAPLYWKFPAMCLKFDLTCPTWIAYNSLGTCAFGTRIPRNISSFPQQNLYQRCHSLGFLLPGDGWAGRKRGRRIGNKWQLIELWQTERWMDPPLPVDCRTGQICPVDPQVHPQSAGTPDSYFFTSVTWSVSSVWQWLPWQFLQLAVIQLNEEKSSVGELRQDTLVGDNDLKHLSSLLGRECRECEFPLVKTSLTWELQRGSRLSRILSLAFINSSCQRGQMLVQWKFLLREVSFRG